MSYSKKIKVLLEGVGQSGWADMVEVADRLEEFEKVVSEMRKEQRAFFSCKNHEKRKEHLVRSKELEKRVDLLLSEMGYNEQQALF